MRRESKASNKPYVAAITALMAERGLTKMMLCDLLYGRDARGHIRGAGAIYPAVNGTVTPGPRLIGLLREKVGLDLSSIKPPSTPAKAALVAYEASQVVEPVRKVTAAAQPPRFSLVIDQDGRARVSLNLMDVSSDEALRCLSALTAANLLSG